MPAGDFQLFGELVVKMKVAYGFTRPAKRGHSLVQRYALGQ
jgi:hypothetical protein